MDISCRLCIFLRILSLCNISQGDMKSSKSYSLAKNCKSTIFGDEYSRKPKLNINLTGALVRSHDDYLSDSMDNGVYPDHLSCELVAEAPVGSRIMLVIESLHIPTENPLCDDNYLYVFDYESSRSKAMAAAGGEKGLCGRTYPRSPIITTGPYMTIVFNSRIKSHKVPHDAGFLLVLTEIQLVDNGSQCRPDQYQCGQIHAAGVVKKRHRRATHDRDPRWRSLSAVSKPATKARYIIPKTSKSSIIKYCIPQSLVCDGVRNCHDSSDEDSKTKTFCSDLEKMGIVNKFLSLGLTASIAIAVGCIIGITLCVGLTACYCVRLCTNGLSAQEGQQTKDLNLAPEYQGMLVVAPTQVVHMDGYFSSSYIAQSQGFITVRDNSSASSFETEKMYCMYTDPPKPDYLHIGRPASEKMCHWATSSLLSFPSNSEGHHSHPETPYFMREGPVNERAARLVENVYRPSFPNCRGNSNSCNHQTPTSSRSAKSTRSTKSSNVDKMNAHQASDAKCNVHSRKYPLTLDESKLRILGPVLGQV